MLLTWSTPLPDVEALVSPLRQVNLQKVVLLLIAIWLISLYTDNLLS
jgi:hypothetical protein